METFLLRITIGAVIGLLVGLLFNALDFWRKNRRDASLRKRGLPLPTDRVPGKYHWVFLAQGLLIGALLSLDLW